MKMKHLILRALALALSALMLAQCAAAAHRCADYTDTPENWARAGASARSRSAA